VDPLSTPADQADGDEGQNEKTQQLESGFQVCWVVLHRYEDIVDEMFGDQRWRQLGPGGNHRGQCHDRRLKSIRCQVGGNALQRRPLLDAGWTDTALLRQQSIAARTAHALEDGIDAEGLSHTQLLESAGNL